MPAHQRLVDEADGDAVKRVAFGEPAPGEKYHGIQFEGPAGWIFVSRDGKLDASDPALITTPLPADAERLPLDVVERPVELFVADEHVPVHLVARAAADRVVRVVT